MPNFSDRFLAKISGTNYSGSTPQQVAETLRKVGVPLEERWPWSPDMDTWDEFYAPIPPKLFDYAYQDFKDIYKFSHEYVNPIVEDIKEALRFSPLGFSVAAWHKKGDVYYKPEGASDNHWCVCYGYIEQEGEIWWKIFDSYDSSRKLYSGMPQIVKRYEISDVRKSRKWWEKLISLLEYIGRQAEGK